MTEPTLFSLTEYEGELPPPLINIDDFDDDPAYQFPCLHDWAVTYQGESRFELRCRSCSAKKTKIVNEKWMDFDFDRERIVEVIRSSPDGRIKYSDLLKNSLRGQLSTLWNLDQLIEEGRLRVGCVSCVLLPEPEPEPEQLPPATNPAATENTTEETTPSKTRRNEGEGSGFIQERLSQGKYKQYYFCWEEGHGENRRKRSKYLNQRLLPKVIKMNQEKLPVKEILKVFETTS